MCKGMLGRLPGTPRGRASHSSSRGWGHAGLSTGEGSAPDRMRWEPEGRQRASRRRVPEWLHRAVGDMSEDLGWMRLQGMEREDQRTSNLSPRSWGKKQSVVNRLGGQEPSRSQAARQLPSSSSKCASAPAQGSTPRTWNCHLELQGPWRGSKIARGDNSPAQ